MADSEFSLIERFFQSALSRPDVPLGVGDDGALLIPPAAQQLVTSVDMLLADVHFYADADPRGIGHKALAVNLSDMAAMGAEPAWATLGIALPAVDESWLAGFCEGFFALADAHGVQLVGGDTTRGPLTISVQIQGFVPPGQALRRDGAKPGDQLLVTGIPGEAAVALAGLQGRLALPSAHREHLLGRLERPTPRIAQGLALRGLASAAIDISDGLVQDLGHLLRRSGVGATLELAQLPRSDALAALDPALVWEAQLGGGDDYELLFCLPTEQLSTLQDLAHDWPCPVTCIGEINPAGPLQLRDPNGGLYTPKDIGFDHFVGP